MSSVVFTFVRANPPTAGHEHVFNTVQLTAHAHNADHVVFLSQTCNSTTDPLSWNKKIAYVSELFPDLNVSLDKAVRTPFEALEHLCKHYTDIVLVVGEDRQCLNLPMSKYAKQWGANSFSIVCAGARSGATKLENISASNARDAAKQCNFNKFKNNMPSRASLPIVKRLYDDVCVVTGTNINEESI